MKKQEANNLKNCETCQINNRNYKNKPVYVETDEPFEKIALYNGNKKTYILLGIDYYKRVM